MAPLKKAAFESWNWQLTPTWSQESNDLYLRLWEAIAQQMGQASEFSCDRLWEELAELDGLVWRAIQAQFEGVAIAKLGQFAIGGPGLGMVGEALLKFATVTCGESVKTRGEAIRVMMTEAQCDSVCGDQAFPATCNLACFLNAISGGALDPYMSSLTGGVYPQPKPSGCLSNAWPCDKNSAKLCPQEDMANLIAAQLADFAAHMLIDVNKSAWQSGNQKGVWLPKLNAFEVYETVAPGVWAQMHKAATKLLALSIVKGCNWHAEVLKTNLLFSAGWSPVGKNTKNSGQFNGEFWSYSVAVLCDWAWMELSKDVEVEIAGKSTPGWAIVQQLQPGCPLPINTGP